MGGDNVASARRSSRQISSLDSTISSEELQVAVEICQSAGDRLVSDETYGLMTGGEPLPPAAWWDRASDRVRFDWPAIERTASQEGPHQAMAKLLVAARAEGAHSRWPL